MFQIYAMLERGTEQGSGELHKFLLCNDGLMRTLRPGHDVHYAHQYKVYKTYAGAAKKLMTLQWRLQARTNSYGIIKI